MSQATVQELTGLIERLRKERQEHVDAVARIDAIFSKHGITAAAPVRRPGRPRKEGPAAAKPKAAPAKRGRKKGGRGKFATSALVSLTNFVKAAGSDGVLSSDIVKHWQEEGRKGSPFPTLGKLADGGALKREDIPGKKGSRYFAVK